MWTYFGRPCWLRAFQSSAAQRSMPAQRVRVGGAVEEVEGRRLHALPAALAARVGQRGGVGAGDVGDLVARHEAHQRLGVGGAPALDGDHAVAAPGLVLADGARRLVAVVEAEHVQLAGPETPFRVLFTQASVSAIALAVGHAHVGGGAGIVHQVPDRDRLGRRRQREGGGRRHPEHCAPHGHRSFPPSVIQCEYG